MRLVGAAPRIGERLDPREGTGLMAHSQPGTALAVDLGVFGDGGPLENVGNPALDVSKLVRLDHVFEDIEAVTGVGLDDHRVELAGSVESDGAAVIQAQSTSGALFPVGSHRPLGFAITDDGYFRQQQIGHADWSSGRLALWKYLEFAR